MLIVLTVVNIILIAYLFILSLRIVLGWFAPQALGRAWEFLTAATDPYLNLFSRVRFLLLLFLIVGLIRTIPLAFRATSGAGLWRVVDMIMQPVVAWVMKVFRLGRRSGYTQHLLLTIGLLFVAWLLGELVVHQIVSLCQMLPI